MKYTSEIGRIVKVNAMLNSKQMADITTVV